MPINVLDKLVTALRGGFTEAGEAMADSQALRILDQELRDASEELIHTRATLASLMAQHKLNQERHTTLLASIEENEGYALKAMELADDALAQDIAKQIAELESQADVSASTSQALGHNVNELRTSAEQASRELNMLKQQVSILRANDSVHRAQAALATRLNGSDSRLQTAKDSLERVQTRQKIEARTLEAEREIMQADTPASLDERLIAAGLKPARSAADAVLDRLKKTNGS